MIILIEIKDKAKADFWHFINLNLYFLVTLHVYPKNDAHKDDQKVLPNLQVPSESPKIKLN